ncbi:protein kinase domain-containing protein [Bacillus sp. Marseille-Q1617]|uniref:serine/threonine protein kinase n=1 Tax=Bacillus sp. Marseille-Q1617 TaxID=2736887 RepID=UPI0015890B1E|nr:protein kinase [Bacillus sp. Marseille-Q1617]
MIDSFEIEWKKGREIQKHQIIECIGKGSYGSAYKVRYKKTGKEAVLKRIRPYKKLFSDHIRYMDNETMILRKLQHPQFPEVYASGCHKRTPYFIMEKMRGKTFEDLIFAEGKSYSEEESLEIGIKLVNLIIDIHRKGYVHRDLRIPNILWDNGVINIIDFGLACKIEAESEKEPLYHKDYMREKTARSDLYALGHFLLFLLYSSYEPTERKEKSWEEELDIRPETSVLIQKLLRIQQPYENAEEAREELMEIRYEKNS